MDFVMYLITLVVGMIFGVVISMHIDQSVSRKS